MDDKTAPPLKLSDLGSTLVVTITVGDFVQDGESTKELTQSVIVDFSQLDPDIADANRDALLRYSIKQTLIELGVDAEGTFEIIETSEEETTDDHA